jgi:hypothetical protein
VFLTAKLPPPYWTWFDVNTNIAGYAPLGFLLALGMLRDGRRARWAVPLAALLGAALSLGMEFLQIYLPRRVPSNLDLSLNAAGALLGALLAALLERLGRCSAGRSFVSAGWRRGPAVRWLCWRCGRRRCCSRRPCHSGWARCWSGWICGWTSSWKTRRS